MDHRPSFRLYFTALLTLVIFASCDRSIYREFHKFDNYTWGRFDKVTFDIPIEKETAGDIVVAIRHLDQFPYNEISMNIILTTPEGEERILERTVFLKDANGKFRGSVAGNQWDIEEILWKNFSFHQEGTYRIEIENIHSRMGMAGLIDIGMIVRKSK